MEYNVWHEILRFVLTPLRLLIKILDREPPPASYIEAVHAYEQKNPHDPRVLKRKAEAELWLRQQLGIRRHDA